VRGAEILAEEREIISRELAAGRSCRCIGRLLNRDHTVVSREVARNGGRSAYRAIPAQRRADELRARPKQRLLETNTALHDAVNYGLEQKWSPKQISKRLRQDFPDDDTMRVSHETIYQCLYLQARGELRIQLKLALRRLDTYVRNTAVDANVEGAARLPPPDEGNILIESFAHGWFWSIPLHTGAMSVGAVVDSQFAREHLQRDNLHAFLMEQLAQAPRSSAMLRSAALIHGPFVVRDWSYASDRITGDGFVLVGDAACFIDPLFSSGVHLALTSGMLAAAYVTSALKDPSIAAPAGAVYKDLYYRQYSHFREMAALFYRSNRSIDSYFWEARRILGESDAVAPRLVADGEEADEGILEMRCPALMNEYHHLPEATARVARGTGFCRHHTPGQWVSAACLRASTCSGEASVSTSSVQSMRSTGGLSVTPRARL